MPIRKLAAAILSLALVLPAFAADKKGQVSAVVTAVKGAPTVQLVGETQQAKVKTGQFLYKGDVVRTKGDDMAAIAMVNGVELRINGNTFFEVGDGGAGDKPAGLGLKFGQIWTRLLHKSAKVRVASRIATMSVRGTEFDAALQDKLDVRVYDGHVDVSNAQGSQSLSEGQMTTVTSASEAPQAPREMAASDRLNWQDGVAPMDVEGQLNKLRKEAGQSTLEFKTKDGKGVKFKLKKKGQ